MSTSAQTRIIHSSSPRDFSSSWICPSPSPSPSPVPSSSSSSSSPSFSSSPAMAPITSVQRRPSSPGPSTSSSSPHRRSRHREILTSFRDLVGHHAGDRGGPSIKGFPTTAVSASDGVHVQSLDSSISLVLPPSLPQCSMNASFRCSETNVPIPPAFYPGQAIPTVLTFTLNRHSSLALSLNPTLTMSLVGTLHLPEGPPRTIICVSVSLAEGLELWSRDAQQAYATRPPKDCFVDPTQCLPGGTYSLPLTVQVPATPRLPPSFAVDGATFAVTYALAVTLTCDDPQRPGLRATLVETAEPFEMMPETLPTVAPQYNPTAFTVRSEAHSPADVNGFSRATLKRSASKWNVLPSLLTTAYSPTSKIPLSITLTPPENLEHTHQVLVRIALVRREHSSVSGTALRDPSGQSGLVNELDVVSRMAWFEVDQAGIDIQTILPIMADASWSHGFSTMLNVGPAVADPSVESIAVSSTFHLAATFAFLPIIPGYPTLQNVVRTHLPPHGVFTAAQAGSTIDMISLKRHFPGTVRTLPLPIVIGSVSEPRNAMQTVRWSDLHLDNSTGQEVGRMVSGETVTCENGWILPPPSYHTALDDAPYVF